MKVLVYQKSIFFLLLKFSSTLSNKCLTWWISRVGHNSIVHWKKLDDPLERLTRQSEIIQSNRMLWGSELVLFLSLFYPSSSPSMTDGNHRHVARFSFRYAVLKVNRSSAWLRLKLTNGTSETKESRTKTGQSGTWCWNNSWVSRPAVLTSPRVWVNKRSSSSSTVCFWLVLKLLCFLLWMISFIDRVDCVSSEMHPILIVKFEMNSFSLFAF